MRLPASLPQNDEKLTIAKQRGAGVMTNTRGKSLSDLQDGDVSRIDEHQV